MERESTERKRTGTGTGKGTGKATAASAKSSKKSAKSKTSKLAKPAKKRTGSAARFFMRTPLKIAVYIVLGILLVVIAYNSFLFGTDVFSEEGVDPLPGYVQTIDIEPNMNAWEIGSMLEEQALIKSRWVFWVQSLVFELKITDDTPGSYAVNSADSGEAIIKMFNEKQKVGTN